MVSVLLRINWHTVGAIVERVMEDRDVEDGDRLAGVRRVDRRSLRREGPGCEGVAGPIPRREVGHRRPGQGPPAGVERRASSQDDRDGPGPEGRALRAVKEP